MRPFVGFMFPRERVDIRLSLSRYPFPAPWWKVSWDGCGDMRHSVGVSLWTRGLAGWVPVWYPVLGRVGQAELDLGSSPVGVKPAVATLICLGTHMLYGPICLLPTNSWLSERNNLVIGHSPIKLLYLKQESSSSDSSPSCIEAEGLDGLTTFISALLAHLGRLISWNTESHLFSSSNNNRHY